MSRLMPEVVETGSRATGGKRNGPQRYPVLHPAKLKIRPVNLWNRTSETYRIECCPKVLKMGFRFELDPVNKILMTRLDGELSDELVMQTDAGMRKYLQEKSPHVHIVDCSSVSRFSLSGESIRSLARREPALHGSSCRRFFVMPDTASFGLARMFQIAGEPHYDSVTIVRSIEEVFTTLAIELPRFEPLEST